MAYSQIPNKQARDSTAGVKIFLSSAMSGMQSVTYAIYYEYS